MSRRREMDAWDHWMVVHDPGFVVEEGMIQPILGCQPWSNNAPARDGKPCKFCGGAISPGEKRYCCRCHKSGNDRKLAAQLKVAVGRKLAPAPPREKRIDNPSGVSVKAKPCNSKLTRVQKRAAKFAVQGVPQP